LKACFQKWLKEKWKRPEGSFKLCRFPAMGSRARRAGE